MTFSRESPESTGAYIPAEAWIHHKKTCEGANDRTGVGAVSGEREVTSGGVKRSLRPQANAEGGALFEVSPPPAQKSQHAKEKATRCGLFSVPEM
jgi:hypothetical protein